MEYRGFHLQHQLQQDSAHYYKPSTCQAWNSSNTRSGYSSRLTESSQSNIINLRDHGQDFGFDPQQIHNDDLLFARLKDVVSDNYSPRLSEMISSPSSSSANDSLVSSISEYSHVTGKEIWPAGNYNLCHHQKKPIDGGIALSKTYNNFGATSSSSSNLSTLEMPPSSLLSCSLGFNSPMLLGGSACGLQLSYDSFGLKEDSMRLSHSITQQRENSPSNSSSKISAFIKGAARTKTTRNCSQPKESEAKAKRSRTTCSPLKVRKEKLGDRIQTLQRLVAPFGKTNTASVLTEAIGYIHFLHDQIQTLSVPYMKSSKTNPFRMVQPDSKEEDGRESKPDLRSRGLCLVPLSYASCIHNFD